jgi:hypothetical protein
VVNITLGKKLAYSGSKKELVARVVMEEIKIWTNTELKAILTVCGKSTNGNSTVITERIRTVSLRCFCFSNFSTKLISLLE